MSLPARYRVLAEVGRGGMGHVVRAHDTVLGRDVAIKLIEDAGPDRARFVREARAAARVKHANIAIVHDVDPEAGWLVMELVDGRSLRDVIKEGALPPAIAERIGLQILSALDAAHSAGIIHRDLKPSNIMVGADFDVKLVDFGIARFVDALDDASTSSGTPAYMAPEQVRGGRIDARADLYGFGATMFEAVVGKKLAAFEPHAAADALAAACADDPELAGVITRCIQLDPAARYASARDALAALRRQRRGIAPWWFAVAGAVVVAGAVAGVAVGRHRKSRDPRVDQAFLLAQRGEDDKALQILADYLPAHRDDPDAQTIAFLATWWQGGVMDDVEKRVAPLELRPAQRAMIDGIDLITHRRDAEAIAFLENAAKQTPGAVEIEFALGEAMWHGQQLEDGAQMLVHAFETDPRWEMALHHVLEYRLSRGEVRTIAPLADKLRAVDAPAAAALDCAFAIGERDYPRAVSVAQAALGKQDLDKIPELYLCLAQAQALVGDLDGGTATAKTAFELWPLETADRGGFAQYAEFLLYRNQLDAYLDLTRGRPSSQRALALLLWRPTTPVDVPEPQWPAKRMAPLGAATWLLQQHVHHVDASHVYASYPEPEIRLWGTALAAEDRGDRDGAIRALREALAVPAKGDVRMLLAHRLAHLLHDGGDTVGAASACDEVIRPRFYVDYRALLVPDCLAWSAAK